MKTPIEWMDAMRDEEEKRAEKRWMNEKEKRTLLALGKNSLGDSFFDDETVGVGGVEPAGEGEALFCLCVVGGEELCHDALEGPALGEELFVCGALAFLALPLLVELELCAVLVEVLADVLDLGGGEGARGPGPPDELLEAHLGDLLDELAGEGEELVAGVAVAAAGGRDDGDEAARGVPADVLGVEVLDGGDALRAGEAVELDRAVGREEVADEEDALLRRPREERRALVGDDRDARGLGAGGAHVVDGDARLAQRRLDEVLRVVAARRGVRGLGRDVRKVRAVAGLPRELRDVARGLVDVLDGAAALGDAEERERRHAQLVLRVRVDDRREVAPVGLPVERARERLAHRVRAHQAARLDVDERDRRAAVLGLGREARREPAARRHRQHAQARHRHVRQRALRRVEDLDRALAAAHVVLRREPRAEALLRVPRERLGARRELHHHLLALHVVQHHRAVRARRAQQRVALARREVHVRHARHRHLQLRRRRDPVRAHREHHRALRVHRHKVRPARRPAERRQRKAHRVVHHRRLLRLLRVELGNRRLAADPRRVHLAPAHHLRALQPLVALLPWHKRRLLRRHKRLGQVPRLVKLRQRNHLQQVRAVQLHPVQLLHRRLRSLHVPVLHKHKALRLAILPLRHKERILVIRKRSGTPHHLLHHRAQLLKLLVSNNRHVLHRNHPRSALVQNRGVHPHKFLGRHKPRHLQD